MSRSNSSPPALPGVCGLDNLGNTCYINSAVQCLAITDLIRKLLEAVEDDLNHPATHPQRLLFELRKILNTIWDSKATLDRRRPDVLRVSVLQPTALKKRVNTALTQFSGYDQHDAQEFLSAILDLFFDECKLPVEKRKVIVEADVNSEQIEREGERELWKEAWRRHRHMYRSRAITKFQGLSSSTIECLDCSEKSIRYEPFMVLSLPVVDTELCESFKTFNQVVEAYLRPEILEGDDQWSCPRCKTLRTSKKTTQIHRFPKLLIGHLKRFTFVDGIFKKLETTIEVEQNRDQEFVERIAGGPDSSATYKLIAVINHSGRYNGGHYSTMCWHRASNSWLNFDDQDVRLVRHPHTEIIGEDNYILFFEKLPRSAHSEQSSRRSD